MQVLNIGEEQSKIIVIDDFLENPGDLVDYAKSASFSPWPIAAERKGYPGVRAAAPTNHAELIRDRLDPIIREQYGISLDAELVTHQETLNLITVPEDNLGPLQRIPHFDTSDPKFFAILLYLCDESHGGTGFYRHNSTGYESITPDRVEHYLDCCYVELNRKRIPKKYFSESDELFSKIGFVSSRFNRLVIYRGGLLHSANILEEKSISVCPVEGRLTANVFIGYEG